MPAISIVIPCRNERNGIERVVRAILDQEPPAGGYELIVADGMSDDGTREVLARIEQNEPRVRVLDNPNRIVSSGLNAAIRAARGEIIIRMDAHTSYAPDYLVQCVTVLKETEADNVGGPWIAVGEQPIGRAIAAVFQSRFGTGGARGHDPNYTGPIDTVYLGCWRRSVFERYGMFDEELVRNQDDEFNLRVLRSGGRIWQSANIRSRYAVRGSLAQLFRQYMQYGYWKVRVIQKHKRSSSLRHFVPGGFVFALICLALVAPWSQSALLAVVTLAGFYIVANLIASTSMICRTGFKVFPLLPFVFACYHFGYGYGFLRGILDFMILQRQASRTYTQLTRDVRTSRV